MIRKLRLSAAICALACAAPAAAQAVYGVGARQPAGYSRAEGQRATREILGALVRIDTRNPPGNEMRTAMYFDSLFRGVPGVERHVLESAPGRANFVARLRALHPTGKPVLVMGHMDVVGTDSARWQTNPLEPTEKDGYLYGRGTIDDKGMLATTVAAMLQLARDRGALKRDVVFLATAGEEGGPPVGVEWVMEHHPELVSDAEFALNEGGRIRVADGRIRNVNVQTTEKVYYEVVATARGTGGHASVPLPGNPLAALARAVARVHEWSPPVRLIETSRLYFQRLAAIETDPAVKQAMLDVSAPGAPAAQVDRAAAVLSRNPLHNAVLRTGAALTLINGGFRANVIPSEGRATFNVRLVPGDDIREFVREMNRVGAEPSVVFAVDGDPRPTPPPSPVSTALYRAMEGAATAMAPGTTVLPFMSTGATDGATLRQHGIATYGILPTPLPEEDELRMHGDNERVPVAALGWGAEYVYRVLAGVAK